MRKTPHLKPLIAGLAVSAAIASQSSAQTLPLEGQSDSDWRYALTFYAFLPTTTTGTSTIAGSSVDLDLDLSDVLDLLDIAFAGRGEAWRGDFGLIADFNYIDLAADGTLGPLTVDADITQRWASVLGGYRFSHGTYGDQGLRYSWDVSAGVRWNSLKQQVDANVPIGPGGQITLGGTETWWEPMVSLRGAYEISERWTLGGRVDLGGFGVNDDDLQYTVLFGADWRPWEKTSLKFGYQFYGIDFETDRPDGAFGYSVDQNGPYIGLTVRF